jgi:hypothetical protein
MTIHGVFSLSALKHVGIDLTILLGAAGILRLLLVLFHKPSRQT